MSLSGIQSSRTVRIWIPDQKHFGNDNLGLLQKKSSLNRHRIRRHFTWRRCFRRWRWLQRRGWWIDRRYCRWWIAVRWRRHDDHPTTLIKLYRTLNLVAIGIHALGIGVVITALCLIAINPPLVGTDCRTNQQASTGTNCRASAWHTWASTSRRCNARPDCPASAARSRP